ncbi:MAG: nuclear transport factor 2 family protein [Paracoccaceae bacterium]
MKPMLVSLLLGGLLMVGTAPVATAQEGTVRALPAGDDAMARAMLDRVTEWLEATRDLGASEALGERLDALLHADFRYQHGGGRLLDAADYRRLLVEGGITVETLGPLDLTVRDLGDTVVTFGHSAMSGRVFGGPYDGYLRFVNVWAREGSAFRLLHRNSEFFETAPEAGS